MRIKSHKIEWVIVLLMMCFLAISCKKSIPKEVIPPSQMENLLYDYQLARALSDKLPYDEREKTAQYMDYVFEKHHTTPEIFDSSLVWYSRHAEVLNKIYAKVNQRFKDELGELNHLIAIRDKKPAMTQPGDTVDIWYASRLVELTSKEFINKIEFTVPVDSNFKVNDYIEWKMRHTFLPLKEKKGSAIISLSVWFENDSVLSKLLNTDRSGMISLSIKPDSAWKIKEVTGYVYYQGADKPDNSSLLIDRISLIRYHVLTPDTLSKNDVPEVKTNGLQDTLRTDSLAAKSAVPEKKITETRDSAKSKHIRKSPKDMNHPRQEREDKK